MEGEGEGEGGEPEQFHTTVLFVLTLFYVTFTSQIHSNNYETKIFEKHFFQINVIMSTL